MLKTNKHFQFIYTNHYSICPVIRFSLTITGKHWYTHNSHPIHFYSQIFLLIISIEINSHRSIYPPPRIKSYFVFTTTFTPNPYPWSVSGSQIWSGGNFARVGNERVLKVLFVYWVKVFCVKAFYFLWNNMKNLSWIT